MGRKLRVEYPGVIYHVMNRGDRRELIFEDVRDRGLFVETQRAGEEGRDYSELRRGWFFGEEALKNKLLERIQGGFAAHHEGAERWESAVQHAEALMGEELGRLGLSVEELKRRRKGDEDKARIARRLRAETAMTLNWIASRLEMGSASMVKHCLNRK